jgi:hypothetical protein
MSLGKDRFVLYFPVCLWYSEREKNRKGKRKGEWERERENGKEGGKKKGREGGKEAKSCYLKYYIY